MISSIVISTRERPEQAREAVKSFKTAHPNVKVCVYDQSSRKTDYGSDRICRPENVSEYIEILHKKGFEKSILRSGLIGGYGGYRNVILLDTIGERVLSTDDDTRARVYIPPGQNLKSIVQSHPNPYCDWFNDRHSWQTKLSAKTDVIGKHESLLGFKTTSASVQVVAAGFVGDAASEYNYANLASRGEARERFLLNFPASHQTREVMQVMQQLMFWPKSNWLRTLNFSFDNAADLPPFLPNGRGECGVFASLLASLPDTAIGYIPWAIEHIPDGREGYKKISYSDDALFYHLTSNSSSFEMKGKALASCHMDIRELRRTIEVSHRGDMRQIALELQRLVTIYGSKPKPWVEEINRFISEIMEPPKLTDNELLLMQERMAEFGRFIGIWFKLREAARELSSQGIRCSVPNMS